MTAGRNIVWNGGYTYFHRDVLVVGLWAAPEKVHAPAVVRAANYALVPRGTILPDGFHEMAVRGESALHRRDGTCEPHPEFERRLWNWL